MLYGDFDLQRRDRDSDGTREAVWGGQGQGAPSFADPPHVEGLQRDLGKLGFHLVGDADGIFGRHTEWAVRELQIYATMPRVAKQDVTQASARYVDMLSAVHNDLPYGGPISGVVNSETRDVIAHWLANDWRCPVVVEAWNMSAGARHMLKASNLWLHDDLMSTAPRMYVRDFSGYWDHPDGRNPDELIVLGDWVSFLDWSGPRSVPPNHSWTPEGELLPLALVGREHANLRTEELSTFKVVRAVSEVECLGFFDSVNSYDNAFVSQGPCHWTLGIADSNGGVAAGEMCGFLAYLEAKAPDAFLKAFGFTGARIQDSWGSDGGALFKDTQRKYSSWVSLQNESGGFTRVPRDERDGDYFKSWHWFYRFMMAGRTVESYRRAMWDMARVRLRDLTTTPWGTSGAPSVGGRPAQIGDVFTSERATGILLRWHIRFPADVITGGKAGSRMRSALSAAKAKRSDLNWQKDPSGWTDTHERTLLDALRDEVAARNNRNLSETIAQVDDWPTWTAANNRRRYQLSPSIKPLRDDRGSFRFDPSGLPPAPV
jgi:hypothetical protein